MLNTEVSTAWVDRDGDEISLHYDGSEPEGVIASFTITDTTGLARAVYVTMENAQATVQFLTVASLTWALRQAAAAGVQVD